MDLKPSIKDLYDRGFLEKISFQQGIEELYQHFYTEESIEKYIKKVYKKVI